MAAGRVFPYQPRMPHTRDIAECVRAYVDALRPQGLRPTGRNLLYHVSSRGLVEKTEDGYKQLRKQTIAMRKGGFIPLDSLSDGSRRTLDWELHEDPSGALLDAAHSYVTNPWVTQPEAVELWCEADTHREFLTPVARAFLVPLFPTHGNPSLPSLLERIVPITARWVERGQPTCILYCGDHDPKGLDMSRKLHKRLVELGMPPSACRVVRVALTYEQIRAHDPPLPSRPPKEGDTLTPWYEAEFPGLGAYELDSVPPRELVDIVRAGLWDAVGDKVAWERHQARDRRVREALTRFVGENRDVIDALGAEEEDDDDE